MSGTYAYQGTRLSHREKGQILAEGKNTEEARTARARITGVNASYKDLCEVCSNVRGRNTEGAIEFLDLAAHRKKAILFARHNHGKGHRTELGGKKGGWPIKSIKIVRDIVKSALANAVKAGMGQTKIVHIIANKQDTIPRMSPKGRRIVHNYETAFVEVVLAEEQKKEGAVKGKKSEAPKANEAKKAEEKKVDAPKIAETKASEAKKAEEKKVDAPKIAEKKPIEMKKAEVPNAASPKPAEAAKQ